MEKKEKAKKRSIYKLDGQRFVEDSLSQFFETRYGREGGYCWDCSIGRVSSSLKRMIVGVRGPVRVSARWYFFALSQHPEILCGLFV